MVTGELEACKPKAQQVLAAQAQLWLAGLAPAYLPAGPDTPGCVTPSNDSATFSLCGSS
jgi:hypothetical protein